jgi:hypothetical protein
VSAWGRGGVVVLRDFERWSRFQLCQEIEAFGIFRRSK